MSVSPLRSYPALFTALCVLALLAWDLHHFSPAPELQTRALTLDLWLAALYLCSIFWTDAIETAYATAVASLGFLLFAIWG